DDLSITRVADLPLDTKPADRGRGHRSNHGNHSHHAGGNANWPAPIRRGGTGAGWGMDDMWKYAIDSGAFDDEDARGVKELDDLGGGRLYDTGTDRFADMTTRMLYQRNQSSSRPGPQPTFPTAQFGAGRNNRSASAAISSRQENAGRAVVPSGSSRPRPVNFNPNPMARPARLATRPTPQVALPPVVPMPEMVIDPNAPLPFDISNVILKVGVKFSSRDIDPAMSALVVLSAAGQPELGYFTVVIYSRNYCQWPISAWYDYYSGDDNLLGVTFQNGGAFQGYQLYFRRIDDLLEFMTTVRSLKDGKCLGEVGAASAPALATAPAPVPAPVSVTAPAPVPAPVPAPASASPPSVSEPPGVDSGMGAVSSQSTSPEVQAPPNALPTTQASHDLVVNPEPAVERATSPVVRVTSPIITNTVVPTTTAEDVQPAAEAENAPAAQPSEAEKDSLVDLEADDASVATTKQPSEAIGLLSTLEPYQPTNGTGSRSPSADVSPAEIIEIAHHMFKFFALSGAGGGTETIEQIEQMVAGVTEGVLKHFMQDAETRGLDAQGIQDIKEMVQSTFKALFEARQKALRARQALMNPPEPPRPPYTVEKLLSLRGAAVSPPAYMADIPYLPKPGDRPRQISSSSRGSHSPYDGNPAASFTRSVSKSADAMQWVLGEPVPTKPEPEKVPKAPIQVAASSAAGLGATQDTGLRSSRWASGAAEIKSKNWFTGPRYEKTWSKRSYLEDLVQLDPQAKVTVGTEDLADFYFPMPNDTQVQPGPVETQPSVVDGSQASTSAGAESGAATPTRTDKIEALTVSMSRLSILSPTAPRTQSARMAASAEPSVTSAASPKPAPIRSASTTSAQPPTPQAAKPKVRGLAASRHSSGTGPASSGKFNFHVPGSARH
ncbi:hypothetical protein C8A01DRAFT_19167, partial [Parachaetomium inaequale]